MNALPLALGGILIATAAFAQATLPPPPPLGSPQGPDAGAPPRPGDRGPGGPDDRLPPPPPRGAAIHVERTTDGVFRLDVKCADPDTTKDCAEVTTQLLDKLGAASSKR